MIGLEALQPRQFYFPTASSALVLFPFPWFQPRSVSDLAYSVYFRMSHLEALTRPALATSSSRDIWRPSPGPLARRTTALQVDAPHSPPSREHSLVSSGSPRDLPSSYSSRWCHRYFLVRPAQSPAGKRECKQAWKAPKEQAGRPVLPLLRKKGIYQNTDYLLQRGGAIFCML